MHVQEHSVFKKRLSSTGETIEEAEIEHHKVGPEEDERLLHDKEVAATETKPCGSCYGAAPKPEDCCNTCEEVGPPPYWGLQSGADLVAPGLPIAWSQKSCAATHACPCLHVHGRVLHIELVRVSFAPILCRVRAAASYATALMRSA